MTKLETFDLKAAPFKTRYENFIGGQWVAPKSGQYMPNISPVTGEVICEVPRSDAADIELALDAAHAARRKWGATSARSWSSGRTCAT